MTGPARTAAARLRIVLGPDIAIGPGKADLLEGISETGSIAAAGRRMGMSYKRAWQLADELNGYFSEPLIEASKGGKAGGGASLTRLGETVLARYRRMEAATAKAVSRDLAALAKAAAKDRQ
ncbi:MAG: LysR family transcriptional regulator [Alphaproteobacteria bacterium]|nr:LysR family transcriptional regulator [Alphaproteobacteria bacterium]MDX5417383.1 LysR family transcriptional regulator [Alphaproteobacteria bacterium]MDX5494854.1 LysR family transcriptional regulator [Alphaproteobacteria bacterium]